MPAAAALRYRAALRRLMGRVRLRVFEVVMPAAREALGRQDVAEREVDGLRVSLYRLATAAVSTAAEEAFESVDGVSGRDLVAQFAVLDLDVLGAVPSVAARLPAFVRRNVDLITSVVGEELEQVRGVVTEAVVAGLRVEEVAARILERTSVASSRAELIARDQVLKLSGEVTRDRQTALGVARYRWSTSNDERVRPRHAELEGTEQSWDDPPEVSDDGRREHPGGDYQCRCVAVPLFDDDLASLAEAEEE